MGEGQVGGLAGGMTPLPKFYLRPKFYLPPRRVAGLPKVVMPVLLVMLVMARGATSCQAATAHTPSATRLVIGGLVAYHLRGLLHY